MGFGQDHSLESQMNGPKTCVIGLFKTNPYGYHISPYGLAIIFHNYNFQHSKKLPGPWAGGPYRLTLTLGLTIKLVLKKYCNSAITPKANNLNSKHKETYKPKLTATVKRNWHLFCKIIKAKKDTGKDKKIFQSKTIK